MVESVIKNLCEVSERLSFFWYGDANSEFITNINLDIAWCLKTTAKMKKVISLIVEAYNEYQETESIVLRMIEQL